MEHNAKYKDSPSIINENPHYLHHDELGDVHLSLLLCWSPDSRSGGLSPSLLNDRMVLNSYIVSEGKEQKEIAPESILIPEHTPHSPTLNSDTEKKW